MNRPVTAIAAFLSRLGIDRAPRFVVQVSLRHATRAANPARNSVVRSGDSSKLVPACRSVTASKVRFQLRFDAALLARADVAAKQQGVTRTAWLHRAAFEALAKFGGETPEG
jgi:hypothetical protein